MGLLRIERHGKVAVLTFDRAETMNPLGAPGDGDEVAQACADINADIGIRCVIVTGAGRAFSAGGDIKAMQARSGAFAGSGVEIRERYRTGVHRLARAIYGLDVPAIAAVNGPAIGLGCDVACMTDIRIAAESAKFGVTFLRLGLIPGDGGAWLLPRAIGMSRASELLFSGNVIDASTAAQWGLVSRIVPDDQLMDEALALANRISQQPAHAIRLAKSLLRHGQATSYDTLLEMSATAQALSHLTDDHEEGVNALIEKRPPSFAL